MQQPGMRGVGEVAVPQQGLAGGFQRFVGPVQVAHRQRHVGFGQLAARPRQLLLRAERAGRAPQQGAGAFQVAQLGQGDATQRQRRRVAAQRDMVQRVQRIARGERAGGGGQGASMDVPARRPQPWDRVTAPKVIHTQAVSDACPR